MNAQREIKETRSELLLLISPSQQESAKALIDLIIGYAKIIKAEETLADIESILR